MEYKTCKVYDSEAPKVLHELSIAQVMCKNDLHESQSQAGDNSTVACNLKDLTISDTLACSYCNIEFLDAFEQRNHYKLDWHRYNLKRALCGSQPVSEPVFLSLSGDFSSISGSESEECLEESDTESGEAEKKSQEINNHNGPKRVRHAKVFFENGKNEILSIYRCLLHSKKEEITEKELVNNAIDLIKKPKIWMIIMLGGGHFAGAIFDNGTITHHKTFHSYTVRAKQGGSQSTRDNKGGNHPKSAGASLRRYNEQALIQHVQEVISSWSEPLRQCSLIMYRATGPHNRSVLFGGKNPPLGKADKRLRNIPIPTKRATFKEIKRVYDVLSSIEIYGSADNFKNEFPKSPQKRVDCIKHKMHVTVNDKNNKETHHSQELKPLKSKNKSKNAKKNVESEEEIIFSIPSESNSDGEEVNLLWDNCTINFDHLQEYADTVSDLQCLRKKKTNLPESEKKKKKINWKRKEKSRSNYRNNVFLKVQRNLIESCENGDKETLLNSLSVYDNLPDGSSNEIEQEKKSTNMFTKEDFINCLNAAIDEESENTLLHLAALKGLPEFITLLLEAGADPTVKNKNKLTPFIVAGNRKTKDSFRKFAASFPNKYDLKKANIPPPLTQEMEKVREEKQKERRKLKQSKIKLKKQEDKLAREEQEEKEKFLALSDREKCALAAERRLIGTVTSSLSSAKPLVLSRCFQCGTDITGKVPFEYGYNVFCSIPCLKAHRAKTSTLKKQ